MNTIVFIPLFLGICLNALAQLLLKTGMQRIGHFDFAVANILPIGMQVAMNPYVIAGLSCYVFSVVAWIIGLSRVDVTIAYPMLSLGYVLTTFAAYFFLQENITAMRLMGIGIIIIGVVMVGRS